LGIKIGTITSVTIGGATGGINGYISSEGDKVSTVWGVFTGTLAGAISGFAAGREANGIVNSKANLTSTLAGANVDIVGNVFIKLKNERK
jgi:hypothetical protein